MKVKVVTRYGYAVTGDASGVNDIFRLLAISGNSVHLKNEGKDMVVTTSEIAVIEEI